MTALRLALTELRRVGTGLLGKIVLIALALVPAIYGGLYLYANKDPYGRMSQVPAAIVVEDAGTTLSTGTRLDAGRDVGAKLVDSKSFDWRMLDRATAERQVRNGTVDFALIIPKDFSASLASSASFTPRQAVLELTTNDANNYLSHSIANQVVAEVTKQVAAQLSQVTADNVLLAFTTIHDKLTTAATGATKLADGVGQLSTGAGQLSTGAGSLRTGLDQLQAATTALPGQTRQLADGARQVSDGNAKVSAAGREVATVASQALAQAEADRAAADQRLLAAGLTQEQVDLVHTQVDGLLQPVNDANARLQTAADQLDALAAGAAQVAAGADTLAGAAPQLASGISQAAAGSAQVADGAATLDDGAKTAAAGAHELADGLSQAVDQIPNPTAEQRAKVAETLGAPITVDSASQASAANYGAGLAPFFMSLALWIGGFTAMTRLRALSNRAIAAGQPSWRVALGGWLAPGLIGLAQGVVCWLIVVFGVGITAAHPWWLLAFMLFVSLVFTGIIHALIARFGPAGQFMALVFMVVQLISAGGTFPWQTLPAPLYPLHHAVPLSYAVDGMRRLLYGGDLTHLGSDLLVLLAWLVGAVALAIVAARRAGTWTIDRVKPEVAPV